MHPFSTNAPLHSPLVLNGCNFIAPLALIQQFLLIIIIALFSPFSESSLCNILLLLLLFQVATPNMRGSLAVIPAVAGTLGLLTTQVLGAYLNWQWLSIVCAGLNVPFLLMLIFIPESPVYLISTEQIERAHKILRVLRGNLRMRTVG